jgi:hypothetical protein
MFTDVKEKNSMNLYYYQAYVLAIEGAWIDNLIY